MQKITIKHLGPIQELEMDIKDFNLLIGEQATGKSTIAKAIYFFRTIKTTTTDYLCQLYDTALYNGQDASSGFNMTLKRELKSIFISLFGFSWDLDRRLYMRYDYAMNVWIDVIINQGSKPYISVRYSPKLYADLKKLEAEALKLHSSKVEMGAISLAYASKERLRKFDYIKQKVNSIFDDFQETYYIPAGRSMLTLLANNRSMVNIENLDLITRQFMQLIDSIHNVFSAGIRNAHSYYPDGNRPFDVSLVSEKLIADLKGDYQYSAGKEYIIMQNDMDDQEKIPINFASSGQQEVLWLLNQLYVLMLKKEKAFVIIEEPEAHLYPSLQNQVMEFISYFSNINDSSILITTHSPYVLTSVNNLYYAGMIIRQFPQATKAVYSIIGNKCSIDPLEFTALKLNPDSMTEDLVNQELDEIMPEMIDEVSDDINGKYVKLFDIASSYIPEEKMVDE